MRILHVCPSFWPNLGGVEKLISELALQSSRAGLDIEILTLRDPAILPPADQIAGIPIRRVGFLNLRYYKPALLPLESLRAADVIHVHNVGALLDFVVATRMWHRKPIVLSTNGGIFHTSSLAPLKNLYFYGFQRWMGRFVDQVVAISGADHQLFAPISKRIDLIEPGIDLGRLANRRGTKEHFRFAFVGRIARNKRVDNLLRAFGHWHRQYGHPFQLRIVGPDWEGLQQDLVRIAEEEGISEQVVFTGAVSESELHEEYGKAAFFVSGSQYEGFGISALEAMAGGCIPIVQPNESFRHLIRDGDNGFLVDFEKPVLAAARLGQIHEADRTRLATAAEQTAAKFSWTEKVAHWLRVYEEVVARSRARLSLPRRRTYGR